MIGLEKLNADFARDLITLVNSLKKLPKTGNVKQTYTSQKTGKTGVKEFRYTPLDVILDKIKEDNNFALLQPICFDKELNKPGIKCVLIHKTGQSLESDIFHLNGDNSKIQEEGAEITYRKRYAVGAFLGIATDEDIDGPRNINTGEPIKEEGITDEQLIIISNLNPNSKEYLINKFGKEISEFTKKEAERVIESLKEKGIIKSKEEIEKQQKEKEEVF